MINDTVYNITGLYYNAFYAITIYGSNRHGDGEPATVTVKTPSRMYMHKYFNLYVCKSWMYHCYVYYNMQFIWTSLSKPTQVGSQYSLVVQVLCTHDKHGKPHTGCSICWVVRASRLQKQYYPTET